MVKAGGQEGREQEEEGGEKNAERSPQRALQDTWQLSVRVLLSRDIGDCADRQPEACRTE